MGCHGSIYSIVVPWKKFAPDRRLAAAGAYDAIHTERYVYAETKLEGQPTFPEFYDLQLDPYELNNAVNDPAYQSIIASLKQKLPLLEKQSGRPPRHNTAEKEIGIFFLLTSLFMPHTMGITN